jgi:hypothetical protein
VNSVVDILSNEERLKMELEEFIHILFYQHLQIELKERSVILIQSFTTPQIVLQLASEILFQTYQVILKNK